MKKYKAAILDDEKALIHQLSKLLSIHCPFIEIVYSCDNGTEMLAYLEDNHIDVLFLDIQMPILSGIEFLKLQPNRSYQVVVTSSYKDFAIAAIKNDVLDFLVKPIKPFDLLEAMDKFKHKASQYTTEDLTYQAPTAEGTYFLNQMDILYVKADDNYAIIYLSNDSKLIVSKTLKDVESHLDERLFFRVHKSYLVNLKHIKLLSKLDGGYLMLRDDSKIPISDKVKAELKSILKL